MAFLVCRGAEVVSLSCNRPTHWNNSQCTPFLQGVSDKILIHLCWMWLMLFWSCCKLVCEPTDFILAIPDVLPNW